MASTLAAKRLRKEYMAIVKDPIEGIETVPLETNILVWHYVMKGPPNSDYEGGYYHGKVLFPKEYPMKAPSFKMITPNGRFTTNTKLCLSYSNFHPESWNPAWSVRTMLLGLSSFMVENGGTLGSINSSRSERREFAKQSMAENCANAEFQANFPELYHQHKLIVSNAPSVPEPDKPSNYKFLKFSDLTRLALTVLAALMLYFYFYF